MQATNEAKKAEHTVESKKAKKKVDAKHALEGLAKVAKKAKKKEEERKRVEVPGYPEIFLHRQDEEGDYPLEFCGAFVSPGSVEVRNGVLEALKKLYEAGKSAGSEEAEEELDKLRTELKALKHEHHK